MTDEMHPTRLAKYSIILVVLGAPASALADNNDGCVDIIRLVGRNISKSVTTSDQRKYFYKQVCESSDPSAGLDFSYANAALGFNYSDKQSYCSTEGKNDTQTELNWNESSNVVRDSLETFLQCKALYDKGIVTRLTVPSGQITTFELTMHRVGGNTTTVDKLTINPINAVRCEQQVSGKTKIISQEKTDINYNLPENGGIWRLTCTRNTIPTISEADFDINKNYTYPQFNLIVGTNSPFGGFAMNFVEAGAVGSAWASDLMAQIAAVNQRLNAAKLTVTRSDDLLDIGSANERRNCDKPDELVFGFQGASFGNQALDQFACASVVLTVPPIVSTNDSAGAQ